jgi:hypothetical protein
MCWRGGVEAPGESVIASAWAEDSRVDALEALGAGDRMLGGRKGELGVNVSLAGEDCGKSDMVNVALSQRRQCPE